MKLFRQSSRKINLRLRADIIASIRNFFSTHNYLEVETPIRIPAPAPETNIDAQGSGSWFLQTSPELCMKRLLASGYSKIFQICKCFRKEERGRKHMPEFTILEWYCSGTGYMEMMDQCENLIKFVANDIRPGNYIVYQGKAIELEEKWTRLSVKDTFEKYASVSMDTALSQNCFDEIMGIEIEPCLGFEKPLFLYDYPVSCGSLARTKPENKFLTERFELYIAGIELCNAFTELTDPDEQRRRFEEELKQRQLAQKPGYPLPELFLEALEHMPEASGNALGIDRLVMLFADTTTIDEVVAFTLEEL